MRRLSKDEIEWEIEETDVTSGEEMKKFEAALPRIASDPSQTGVLAGAETKAGRV
jgi:hypothetical protein